MLNKNRFFYFYLHSSKILYQQMQNEKVSHRLLRMSGMLAFSGFQIWPNLLCNRKVLPYVCVFYILDLCHLFSYSVTCWAIHFFNSIQTCNICPPQREETVVFSASTCCHGEWRFVLHTEREVEPSGRAGAETVGGVQKDQHIC